MNTILLFKFVVIVVASICAYYLGKHYGRNEAKEAIDEAIAECFGDPDEDSQK